jgi:hypothetical protein
MWPVSKDRLSGARPLFRIGAILSVNGSGGAADQEAAMVVDTNRVVLELEYRGLVPLADALGTRISCRTGRIWITQHGSRDDILLEAGESAELSHPGLAVVQALRPARFVLQAPAAPRLSAGAAPRFRRLWRRVAAPPTPAAQAGRGAI